jgi:rRNA-processing protein FCF1
LPTRRGDQPCAQRCRAADHAILAVALQARAVLVSNDRALLREATDAGLPAAVSVDELRHKLN